jgi:hypothetical protein
MDDLVQRLSSGDHPIELVLRPTRSAEALKDSIERGYVHVKFTGTRGGTELSVRLDKEATDLSEASFAANAGRIRLVGELMLNYEKVRCIAEADLATFEGTGRLEPAAVASAAP